MFSWLNPPTPSSDDNVRFDEQGTPYVRVEDLRSSERVQQQMQAARQFIDRMEARKAPAPRASALGGH
jgi:hypothetical protein